MASGPRKSEEREDLFCQEYIKDLNVTQAAIRAGYSEKPEVAAVQGQRLFKKDKVKRRIQELMDKRSKRTEIDADKVLRELARIGFSDLRDLFDDMGNVKDPKEWPQGLARAVSSIEVFEERVDGRFIGQTKKVKFWDKTKALELMGKYLKLFTDRVEHSGKLSLEELVVGSFKEKEEG